METRPPTVTRILVALGFALSCFGLALFLWIAFGGPLPLKPEGYRFTVPFTEATPARRRVGRPDLGGLGRQGEVDRALEQGRLRGRDHRARQPIRADSRQHAGHSALRRRSSARPTSSSHRDRRARRHCRRAGSLPTAQVASSVQLDEVFRTFGKQTRQNFKVWMQGSAAALKGRGADFGQALAELEPVLGVGEPRAAHPRHAAARGARSGPTAAVTSSRRSPSARASSAA